MGAFDDLIPGGDAGAPAAAPNLKPGGGPFDDLIPTAKAVGGYPTADNKVDIAASPGLVEWTKEIGKAFVQGAGSVASSAVKGLSALPGTEAQLGVAPTEELGTDLANQYSRPVQESPFFKAGQKMEDVLPQRGKGFEGRSLPLDVASGAGSLFGNIGTMMLGGPFLGVPTLISSGAGQQIDDAIKSKATPEQTRTAALLGNIGGATDLVDALLPTLGSAGKAAGFIKKVGLTAISAAMEAGQEGLQQFIQNMIAQGIYDPKRDLMEDVGYNALIGGIVGGAAHPILAHIAPEADGHPTSADVNQAVNGMTKGDREPMMPQPTPPPKMPNEVVQPPPAATTPPTGGYDELNPPPHGEADLPTPGTPHEGPVNIDLGFDTSIQRRGPNDPYTLVDGEGNVLAKSTDFGEISRIGNEFLDSGNLPTQGDVGKPQGPNVDLSARAKPVEAPVVVNPDTHLDPKVTDFIAKKVPRLTLPTGVENQPNPNNVSAPAAGFDMGHGYKLRKGNFGGDRYAVFDPEGNPVITSKDRNSAKKLLKGIFTEKGLAETTGVGEHITMPAVRINGRVFTGAFHPDAFDNAARGLGVHPDDLARHVGKSQQQFQGEQRYIDNGQDTVDGFVTDTGRFVGRDEALRIAEKAGQITPTASQQTGLSSEDLAPMAETTKSKPGANVLRLAKLLGAKLYGTPENLPAVSVKEMLQNSFDAVRRMLETGDIQQGIIKVATDSKKRTITFYDNGSGMSPSVLGKQFLEIAGTHKEGKRSSGGFGIAKMLTLYANKGLHVITMRDGKVSKMSTSGEELLASLEDPQFAPDVVTSEPTAQELSLFPDGHGTVISITVPETYEDPETHEQERIYFPSDASSFESLTRSPLFSNIKVSFNDKVLPDIGSTFNADDYTPFVDMKFGWGKGRVYVSKKETPNLYSNNAFVLSNGIWQFSQQIKKDPNKWASDGVPRTFYVDIEPSVKPDDIGYPFELNRQGFSKVADKDITQIFHHLSALFRFDDMRSGATNFGQMYYLDMSADGKKLNKSGIVKIEPKSPDSTPIALIKEGDKVVVKDGKLEVDGKELPVLSPNDVSKLTPDVDTLKVDQSEIDPNRIMVHDNTLVKVSDTEQKGILELAQEKFGGTRLDQWLHDIGKTFQDIRNAVAGHKDFAGVMKEALGISVDKEYRGVSIRLPFSGSFINPAIPESSQPLQAAVGMYYTMLHELAHHIHRSEDGLGPVIQRLATYLDTHPTFDAHASKQRLVNTVATGKDIFDYINGFYSGAYTLESRGKRFKTSSELARDVSALGASAQVSDTGRGRQVSGPDRTGPARSAQSLFSGQFGRNIEEERSDLPNAERVGNTAILRSVDPGLTAEQPQSELAASKQAVAAVVGGPSGAGSGGAANARQLGIHADHMNKLMKWMWGLDRLVDKNRYFAPLLRYAERIREMRLDTSKIHDAGLRIAKKWRSLGKESEPLAALLDDVTNMVYRTPQEISKGVRRMPTAKEFSDLVAKHNVSANALEVFDMQRKFFSTFLDLITQNANDAAMRTIQDPIALAAKLDAIRAQKDNLSKAPYFPFTRFGSHFVTVRDLNGNVKFFTTFERRGAASAERQQQAMMRKLEASKSVGDTVVDGVLPETAQPFVGLPPEMLNHIATELSLTKDQLDALDQLRYQFAPAASFVHHYQQKNYTPGYSHDFLRAFSRYAFHGGRYYSRTKYAWALRDEIKAARGVPGNKAGAIANYMEDHLQNTVLDAKGDFGILKGAIFLWVFGYSPAGAVVNLSQIPMISLPFLAAKFGGLGVGDARATKALVKAMTNLGNFYRKGAYDNMTEFEGKAFDYGIKSGRISEAMASQLAGMAQGENLLGLGGSKAGRAFQIFMEKAASMFELSEQFNRRVTYRAALDLAMAHPNSVGVKEALAKYADEYTQLQAKGFTKTEAAAIVAASHATEQTQFVYARETRPRAFRGKTAGTILVFKTYMLNVMQLMGANKTSVLPRFMLMMMLMGGVMGLPGADDLADIMQQLGKWWFGKDFNVRLALRQLILDLGNGAIPPDLALNGLARKGFGIPAIVDLMGEHPGRGLGGAPDTPETRANFARWSAIMRAKGAIPGSYEEFRKQHSQNVSAPVVDMSKSLGMGRLTGIDIGKVLDPGADPNGAVAATAQQASGAVFSLGFNLYKALNDEKTPASDFKRWERVLPRTVASLSRAYRAYNEGRERSKGTGPAGASTVVPYDARDPEQAAEIMAMAAGFMPARQSAQWDRITAEAEVEAHFKFQKQLLSGQYFEAVMTKDPVEIEKVRQSVLEYNRNLPEWAKAQALTGDQLRSSIQQQAKNKAYREAGVPRQRTQVPIARHVQGLFPESVVDVRRVAE